GRVDAPAGLNRDVLLAVDLKRNRYRRDPGACREFPEDLAGLGVEGAEQAIVGATREQKPAAGRKQRTPVERRQVGRPYLFAGVEVPGLQLADVVGPGHHLQDVLRHPHVAFALHIFDRLAGQLGAQVVVGGNIHHPRLRAVGDRRPILAAPQAGAELGGLACPRLARLIDIRSPGLRVEALEDVLPYEGLAVDEVDLAVGAFELPEVAVARDVHETLYGFSVAPVVDDNRGRDLVPVPGVVGMILEMALDRTAGG